MELVEDLGFEQLHLAAYNGAFDLIRELRVAGTVNINTKTAGGFTSAHLAAIKGHTTALNVLLGWPGVDVEAVTDEGFSALHLAAHCGHLRSVKALLKKSRKSGRPCHLVNIKDKVFGRTAVHYASAQGHNRVVKLLLAFPGVNVCSGDEIRDITPLLLIAMKPRYLCNMKVVRLLAEKYSYDQLSRTIGKKPMKGKTKVVREFGEKKWRKFCPLLVDGGDMAVLRTRRDNERAVEDAEKCPLRRRGVLLGGQNALHLAASRDNGELVTYLLNKYEKKQINAPDSEYGMTPLHCAVRMAAMEAFTALVSYSKVKLNRQVTRGGRIPCQILKLDKIDLKFRFPTPIFSQLNHVPFDLNEFQQGETPVHLAIRYCNGDQLKAMMLRFCCRKDFKPDISCGLLPLELAWHRAYVSLPEPLEESRSLQHAIEILERHPRNEIVMNLASERKREALDAVNAILVTAALLAGVTFEAFLQPPFGTAFETYKVKIVRMFWTLNCLSFYFATFTILACLDFTMRPLKRVEKHSSLYTSEGRQFVTMVPLIICVVFGIGAFTFVGFGNLPPGPSGIMSTCTGFGVVFLTYRAIRRIRTLSKEMGIATRAGKDDVDWSSLVTWTIEGVFRYNLLHVTSRTSGRSPAMTYLRSFVGAVAVLSMQIFAAACVIAYSIIWTFFIE